MLRRLRVGVSVLGLKVSRSLRAHGEFVRTAAERSPG